MFLLLWSRLLPCDVDAGHVGYDARDAQGVDVDPAFPGVAADNRSAVVPPEDSG